MSAITTAETAALEEAAPPVFTDREVLSFRLGSEEYGIDIQRVREIRSYETPTRIAGSEPALLGVLDLRGLIVPVIDLRVCFGLPAEFDLMTVTVILQAGGRTVGAVVDAVSDVLRLERDQIKPPPVFDSLLDLVHIDGIGSVPSAGQERLMILVDIDRLLTSARTGLAAIAQPRAA